MVGKIALMLLLALSVLSFAAPDLAVSGISVQPDPLTGIKSDIIATVENAGNEEAGESILCVFIAGKQYAAVPVGKIAPGAQKEAKLFWWAQAIGSTKIEAVANCKGKVAEQNIQNDKLATSVSVGDGGARAQAIAANTDRGTAVSNNLLTAISTSPQGILAFLGVCATAVLLFAFLSRKEATA